MAVAVLGGRMFGLVGGLPVTLAALRWRGYRDGLRRIGGRCGVGLFGRLA